MAPIRFTDQQQRAIRTTGRSLIVSAAAGSGKTAVLAQRCAYLVCDAPPDQRCDIDQLLVLTFTDAAAAQMRSRIAETIRSRADARPEEDRLREQVARTDAAAISTIHAFCLKLIRRWFSHTPIDPGAAVLDQNEARLLKRDVLETVFNDLYAVGDASGEPLGCVEAATASREGQTTDASNDTHSRAVPSGEESVYAKGQAFVKLVNDYGLGNDRAIGHFVLKLFDFSASLPDQEGWLRKTYQVLRDHPEKIMLARVDELQTELRRQLEFCDQAAATLERGDPIGHVHAEAIRAYGETLHTWSTMLDEVHHADAQEVSHPSERVILARYEKVRQAIANHTFSSVRGARLPEDTPPATRAARDRAVAQLKEVRNRLFGKRLKAGFALFSVEDSIHGLRQTAPYVQTLVDLVLSLRDAYAARKREMNVLDFADQERLAFQLLHAPDDPDQPSDIARGLHRRFAHVLVDEFQDVNPIQEAIIRLVSHESVADPPDNLFVVGDVKQSIYGFRLADPSIFNERLERFRRGPGVALSLQSNFRSRRGILSAVNHVFRRLMREGLGPIVFDEEALLHPGREDDSPMPSVPVEVHLLEKMGEGDAGEDDALEPGMADLDDPARWELIEREAYLIGLRIREWMDGGQPVWAEDRPRYRDIAILLRAKKVNAERMASILSAMNIPAYADVGGSLFAAREVRDVVSALKLFDNFQQDIPLASVLRSGILGESFLVDDLVEIRCLDRDLSFHEVVRRYARCGPDAALRERLNAFLERVKRYRRQVRQRPLPEVLWRLYQREGFLAHAGGCPGGALRRANLLKLHALARQFSTFRRQGLFRFLRFMETLEEEQEEVAVAPTMGEAEDVVRIMSIHQAKGLEFPIVFVAGLGREINLGDVKGRMIFDRKAGIGLRNVDTQRMMEYPSVAHQQVASKIAQATREEELRVLYVAMTRARDQLVLVGSRSHVDAVAEECRSPQQDSLPTAFAITTATTPLDWLLPAISSEPVNVAADGASLQHSPDVNQIRAASRASGDGSPARLFDVRIHTSQEMARWRLADRTAEKERAAREAVSSCRPLPPHEPLAPDDPAIEQVLSRLEFVYPRLATTSVRASIAASEFKGPYDALGHADFHLRAPMADEAPSQPINPDDAAHRGLVTHRILQYLDFTVALDPPGVARELERLVADNVITAQEGEILDSASIQWFVRTPLAQAIRRAGNAYRREFHYIATEPVTFFDRSVPTNEEDMVLVRGVVDGILPGSHGMEIIDFKTDRIQASEVARRSRRYHPQLELYARAVSLMWRRPVRIAWLVFLSARELVKWKVPDSPQ